MTDLSDKKRLADEAKDLLDAEAFTQAVLALRKRMFGELMAAETTEQKLALIERIRGLEDLPAELQVMINDYKMAARMKHAS
jgi:hypothetical protein